MHFQICTLGATSPDILTQIEILVHSSNIPGHCLWIDTSHAYVWVTWNFSLLMGRTCFEIIFPPSKILWNLFWHNIPSVYIKWQLKMLVGLKKVLSLHSWHALLLRAAKNDTWYVTPDTWHMTHDTWHLTHGGGWTFSQTFSSLALMVWV